MRWWSDQYVSNGVTASTQFPFGGLSNPVRKNSPSTFFGSEEKTKNKLPILHNGKWKLTAPCWVSSQCGRVPHCGLFRLAIFERQKQDVVDDVCVYIHTMSTYAVMWDVFTGRNFNLVCRLRKPVRTDQHWAGALYSTTRQSTGVSDTRVVAFNSHGSLVFPR